LLENVKDYGIFLMENVKARRLREQQGSERVRLIAMTGCGQEADRRRSQDAGFDHHLVKPVDPAKLQELLGTFCAPG
jgi:CheY-like chemotaxis protein